MTQKENDLLEKAALAAFSALMAKDTATKFSTRAAWAWEAGGGFVKARAEFWKKQAAGGA
jgi:ketosteroid isomerase-like protein